MSKFKSIDELIDPVLADPQRRANVALHRLETIAEGLAYNLAELRKAKELTQAELARMLGRGQPAISEFEHSVDPKLSSLREYVEALGGRLEVAAVFDDDERIKLEV
jgi:DNA-binding XRE family transcriptional regulator